MMSRKTGSRLRRGLVPFLNESSFNVIHTASNRNQVHFGIIYEEVTLFVSSSIIALASVACRERIQERYAG